MIQVSDIIKLVRSIINEAATPGDSFTEESDEMLLDFIRTSLRKLSEEESVLAEVSEVSEEELSTFSQRPDGNFYAEIRLPDDYLRFVSVKLDGWQRSVSILHPDNVSLYSAQYSSAPGIGNGPASPVAFMTSDTERAIIAHSVQSAAGYTLRYVPYPSISEDGTVNMAGRYLHPIAYMTASLYHLSINAPDSAQQEMEMAVAFLNDHK